MDDAAVWTIALMVGILVSFLVGYFYGRRGAEPLYAGEIEVTENANGTTVYSLNLNCEPEDLLAVNSVYFNIVGGRTKNTSYNETPTKG